MWGLAGSRGEGRSKRGLRGCGGLLRMRCRLLSALFPSGSCLLAIDCAPRALSILSLALVLSGRRG